VKVVQRNLTAAIRRYPHTELIFENPLELSDGSHVAVQPWRDRAPFAEYQNYDIAEMPILNYIAARELGLDVTALPVFPSRRFVQWMLEVPLDSPITGPSDLAGKRVGSTYYGNIDYVWTRGILTEDYGVDLSGTTWVTTRREKVSGARIPGNVECVEGADLNELLRRGTIDARFIDDHGQAPDPGFRRLWPAPERAIAEWYAAAGYFPILHTVVVRNSVLAAHENLAAELYTLLDSAKAAALVKYDFGARLPEDLRAISLRAGFPGATRDGTDRGYLGKDPLPYGLAANRPILERLVRYAHVQQAIWSAPSIDELFVPVGA
jgi:4,5-dihydroxyphthalate decarboxylase